MKIYKEALLPTKLFEEPFVLTTKNTKSTKKEKQSRVF
jgi:hypothetical protein